MEPIRHTLDPDGEIIIVLQDPAPPFAVWDWDEDTLYDDPLLQQQPFLRDEFFLPEESSQGEKPFSGEESFSDADHLQHSPIPQSPYLHSQYLHPRYVHAQYFNGDAIGYNDISFLSIDGYDNVPDIAKTTFKIPLETEPPRSRTVEIRVSARHLKLAFPQSKRMLSEGWKEDAAMKTQGFVRVDVPGWDPNVLLFLMFAVHHKARSVPVSLELEELAKMAVLVDYYECLEVVEPFITHWIAGAGFFGYQEYSRDMVLRLCIAWVFRLPRQFHHAIKSIGNNCRRPVQTMELPIPERVYGRIESLRIKAIEETIEDLHKLVRALQRDERGCSSACCTWLREMLINCLGGFQLYNPRPTAPFSNFSLVILAETIREMPNRAENTRHEKSDEMYLYCGLEANLEPIAKRLDVAMESLTLDECLLPP